MRAIKGNRQYEVTSAQVDTYLKQGFDILDDNGNIVEHGAGKSVPYSEYQAVLDELNELKVDGVGQVDKELKIANDELESEIVELKEKNKDLRSKNKELQSDNEGLMLENEALKSQLEDLKLELDAATALKPKK